MKKEGIMRINSYNKFFAKVAEIMDTSVKSVKQLDGRYKVELANHVYLNVYRGVGGSLFIHDHRGIAHITSCYDFEDFKAMKDLYERLVSDYSESAKKEVMEVNQELNARFGKDQYFDTDDLQPNKAIIAKIENINHCPNQNTCCIVSPLIHCNYNYKSDSCIKAHNNFIHDCERLHKQMKAKSNPEWHHVSLATLANIDNDMLDAKRQCYMYVYRLLKDFRKYAFETSRREVYFDLVRKVIKEIQQGYFNNEISIKAYNYACRHIESVSVEKNYFTSNSEQAFGYKESKRYKITLR